MVLVSHARDLREPTWDLFLWRPLWSGVDLFFVLSGFLISGLLFAEYRTTGRINFQRFAIRRALKIYPGFYAIVFFTLALRLKGGLAGDPSHIWRPFFHDILFVQSYLPGEWGPFWSLSVEEHFYILLPLLLWLMLRSARGSENPFRALPRLIGVVACALIGVRLLTDRFVKPFDLQTHMFPTHLRIDSLFFGVLLSYLSHFHGERFWLFVRSNLLWIRCAAALLIAPAFFISQYDPWSYTLGFTLLYLGYGCLLISFLQCNTDRLGPPVSWCLRAIAQVGSASYSIYLWHMFWLFTVAGLHLKDTQTSLLLYYCGAIALGMIASKLIEYPTLRLRDRLFPRIAVRGDISGTSPA
jgi:peptidoglycan/LPS O-acetylase OafA/YrhL